MLNYKEDHLYFLPLGGIGIFGANCYLYRYHNKWIMIDCGIGFNTINPNKVDLLYPNLSFLTEIKEDLLGVICTHSHEDHIGAIIEMLGDIKCPIFASEFTVKILEQKLDYKKISAKRFSFKTVKPYEKLHLEDFSFEFMPVVHSVPGGFSIKMKTGDKTIIHAGDWRLDSNPIIEKSDEKQWKQAGKEGVYAFLCDSTDFGEFSAGREEDLIKPLSNIFSKTIGCAYVSIFASNIGRIKVIIKAAKRSGRRVGIVGLSLIKNSEIAEECGLLDYDFLSEDDMATMPKDEMVIVLTGPLGQKNSGLVRLSKDRLQYLNLDLDEDDVVILSARKVPGNEESINLMINRIESYGAEVITSEEEFVHVSGHSTPEHIAQMFKWLKPELMIAIHGEVDMLEENLKLAKEMEIPYPRIVNVGEVFDMDDKKVIGEVKTGLLTKVNGQFIPTTKN